MKVIDAIRNPLKVLYVIAMRGGFRFLDDEVYLKLLYRYTMKKPLNLKNPKTYNEKLQWLKLHDRNPHYTMLVDKYEVKEYIKNLIGEEYIIPTLGIWNSFGEIDFDKLPQQFVLKCTHDSGGVVICRDKSQLDIADARKRINKALKRNYYWAGREWPYKNIKPRIIAEKYLEDESKTELIDYKLMCFNGEVKCSFVCSNRKGPGGLCVNFYDREWNPMPFCRHYPKREVEFERPEQYEKMVEIAETLADKIPFVRVDLYICNHQIYFGEMTFYPGNGMEEFTPEEWDEKLGDWIIL